MFADTGRITNVRIIIIVIIIIIMRAVKLCSNKILPGELLLAQGDLSNGHKMFAVVDYVSN